MAFRLDPATAINDPHGISWGMHPIAWRNDDVKEVGAYNTLEDELLDLADLGYPGTEVAGWYPSKEETKERADARGIKIVAQWFSSFIVRDGIDAVIPEFTANCEYLQYLGATRIVSPSRLDRCRATATSASSPTSPCSRTRSGRCWPRASAVWATSPTSTALSWVVAWMLTTLLRRSSALRSSRRSSRNDSFAGLEAGFSSSSS